MGNTTELIAEELRAKNKMDQIPVLEFTEPHSGETMCLTRSLAIIEYLEDAFPAPQRVMPTCSLKRARARQVHPLLCICSLSFINFYFLFLLFLFFIFSSNTSTVYYLYIYMFIFYFIILYYIIFYFSHV